uniref:PDZ domain-containing protein n=1 Tax=Clytia hemisphaerica TaxID=252671 RepID=A0A7M5X661_9CNID
MGEDVGLVKAPRICEMIREESGYGFNLHGEKGVIGQYISAIDPGSAAEKSGLCVGDRVVEVNEVNVEAMSHGEVVQQIRTDPKKAILLVVDKITDNYLKKIKQTCYICPCHLYYCS